MIRKIDSIRDLLTVAMAPDLQTAMRNLAQAQGAVFNPELADMQHVAGLLVDSITPRSLELLAELHAKQASVAKKKHH